MKLNKEKLIAELIEITRENLNQIEKFIQLSNEELNRKPNEGSWSILECIAHLNIYGNFYLPELQNCIEKGVPTSNGNYSTGVIGNYFVKLIKPKDKLNKMKTMKQFNPTGSVLSQKELTQFKDQQFQMLDILSNADKVDFQKNKTAISISKLMKMRLGDTFRFVIYHNQRHTNQANNVLKSINTI